MGRKSNIVFFFVFFIITAVSLYTAIFSKNDIISVITTFSTLAGVAGLLYNLIQERRITEASFLFDMYTTFHKNERILQIGVKLEEVFLSHEVSFTEADRQNMVECLTFFEALANMERRGVVSINSFDSLFGYNFFILVNNNDVRKLEYIKFQEYYIETARLEKKWRKYRIKNGLPIPLENNRVV